MKTDVKNINDTRKTITVTFTSEEVATQEASLVKDFQRQAKIPGFRPGKAPENMVRSRYAKELKDELKQRVISKAHQEGVVGAEFEVFNIVDLDEGEISSACLLYTSDAADE